METGILTALITLGGVFLTASGGIIVAVIQSGKKTDDNLKKVNDSIKAVDTKVDAVETKLNNHISSNSKKDALDARRRFLCFYEEEKHGQKHSRDHWLDILDDCTVYDRARQADKDFPNHKGGVAMEYLEKTFKVLDETGDFL